MCRSSIIKQEVINYYSKNAMSISNNIEFYNKFVTTGKGNNPTNKNPFISEILNLITEIDSIQKDTCDSTLNKFITQELSYNYSTSLDQILIGYKNETLDMEDYLDYSNNILMTKEFAYEITQGNFEQLQKMDKLYNISINLLNYQILSNKRTEDENYLYHKMINLICYIVVIVAHTLVFSFLINVQLKYKDYQNKISEIFNKIKFWELKKIIDNIDNNINYLTHIKSFKGENEYCDNLYNNFKLKPINTGNSLKSHKTTTTNPREIKINIRIVLMNILKILFIYILLVLITTFFYRVSHYHNGFLMDSNNFGIETSTYCTINPYLYSLFYKYIAFTNTNKWFVSNSTDNATEIMDFYNSKYSILTLHDQIMNSQNRLSSFKDSFNFRSIFYINDLPIIDSILQESFCKTNITKLDQYCDTKSLTGYYSQGVNYYLYMLNLDFEKILNKLQFSNIDEVNKLLLLSDDNYFVNYDNILLSIIKFSNESIMKNFAFIENMLFVVSSIFVLSLFFIIEIWKTFIEKMIKTEEVSKKLIFDLPIQLIENNKEVNKNLNAYFD